MHFFVCLWALFVVGARCSCFVVRPSGPGRVHSFSFFALRPRRLSHRPSLLLSACLRTSCGATTSYELWYINKKLKQIQPISSLHIHIYIASGQGCSCSGKQQAKRTLLQALGLATSGDTGSVRQLAQWQVCVAVLPPGPWTLELGPLASVPAPPGRAGARRLTVGRQAASYSTTR